MSTSAAVLESPGNSAISASVMGGPVGDVVPSVFVREAGPCRSVFVLRPSLSGDAWKELANRVELLSKNETLNSILVTTHKESDVVYENGIVFPLTAHDIATESFCDPYFMLDSDPYTTESRHALGGLDPLLNNHHHHTNDDDDDDDRRVRHRDVVDGIAELTLAVHDKTRKIPWIVCPHGLVTDGGFALLAGQYVLATPHTALRVDHPLAGLALDPCGLSYALPRVGRDHRQSSAVRLAPTIAAMVALAGFEADGYDLVATGLATHFTDEVDDTLPLLARALADHAAYADQGLVPGGVRTQRQRAQERDHYLDTGHRSEDVANRRFRNMAVHHLVEAASVGMAGRHDFLAGPQPRSSGRGNKDLFRDDVTPVLGTDHGSDLLDYADAFHTVFQDHGNTDGVQGMMEGLREKACDSAEPKEITEMAAYLLQEMERRSPLSLLAVHRLLEIGKLKDATMVDCVQRERIVQKNMLESEDFASWMALQQQEGRDGDSVAPSWKHGSVTEVLNDEVEELFRES